MDDDNERAIVPFFLTRHIFSKRWTGQRLRRRWFKAPEPLRRKPPPPGVKRRQGYKPPPPTKRKKGFWTDRDDDVIRLFNPRIAAELLGRSLDSVYKRRSRITVSRPNVDRAERTVRRREDYE